MTGKGQSTSKSGRKTHAKPRKQSDLAFQRLIQKIIAHLARVLLSDIRLAGFEELNRNLTQSSEKQVDILYKSSYAGDPDSVVLLHIEILADVRADFEIQMLQYRTMLVAKYGKHCEIYQFVLYVGNAPFRMECEIDQKQGLNFWFSSKDIRTFNAESFLASESLDFQLLGFLADKENTEATGRGLVNQVLAEDSENKEEQVTRLEILELFATLREKEALSNMIKDVLLGDKFRQYSTTYRIGKEEGIEIGKQEGKEEGIQIGKQAGKEEGRMVEKWALAQKLHLLGESLEKIALLTDLPLEDLEARWPHQKNGSKSKKRKKAIE